MTMIMAQWSRSRGGGQPLVAADGATAPGDPGQGAPGDPAAGQDLDGVQVTGAPDDLEGA